MYMNITIKTKNLDLTPAIKEYIEEKIGSLNKLLQPFEAEGHILAEVEIARTSNHHHKGDVFYAEVNVKLPNKMLRVSIDDSDVRVAIDRARDVLGRDISKYKEKGGMTGKAMRHMARLGKGAIGAASKLMWWRDK